MTQEAPKNAKNNGNIKKIVIAYLCIFKKIEAIGEIQLSPTAS